MHDALSSFSRACAQVRTCFKYIFPFQSAMYGKKILNNVKPIK